MELQLAISFPFLVILQDASVAELLFPRPVGPDSEGRLLCGLVRSDMEEDAECEEVVGAVEEASEDLQRQNFVHERLLRIGWEEEEEPMA